MGGRFRTIPVGRAPREAHMRRETAIDPVRELRDAGYLGADMGKGRRASKYWSTVPVAVAQTVPQKGLAVTHSALAVAQTGASGTAGGSGFVARWREGLSVGSES